MTSRTCPYCAAAPARLDGDMQDGMLAYYLTQAKLSDANVQARIEREPFDFRDLVNKRPMADKSAKGLKTIR